MRWKNNNQNLPRVIITAFGVSQWGPNQMKIEPQVKTGQNYVKRIKNNLLDTVQCSGIISILKSGLTTPEKLAKINLLDTKSFRK